MPQISEVQAAPGPLAAALAAGVNNLSKNQAVLFTQYTKYVFPVDGSVFWVATGTQANYTGSLHYITDRQQNEDETVAKNRFIFTALEEVTSLNTVSPEILWVGTWQVDGTNLQVVFSDRGSFYQQADLWHYSGYAVYPGMSTQLVNSSSDLPASPIVSNSLPIWLSINSFAPVYPSYLVPDNIQPPYIAVHIPPESTTPLGAFQIWQWPGTVVPDSGASPLYDLASSQLMQDDVEITLYGFNNQQALQYQAYLTDYSVSSVPELYGFVQRNPVMRDDKRTQVEIVSLAMKKTFSFSASYYQGTPDAIAKRLILSAGFTLTTQELDNASISL